MFDRAAICVREFKRLRQEEAYFEALQLAETLQEHLIHYEDTLRQRGEQLPYTVSIQDRFVNGDYDT